MYFFKLGFQHCFIFFCHDGSQLYSLFEVFSTGSLSICTEYANMVSKRLYLFPLLISLHMPFCLQRFFMSLSSSLYLLINFSLSLSDPGDNMIFFSSCLSAFFQVCSDNHSSFFFLVLTVIYQFLVKLHQVLHIHVMVFKKGCKPVFNFYLNSSLNQRIFQILHINWWYSWIPFPCFPELQFFFSIVIGKRENLLTLPKKH